MTAVPCYHRVAEWQKIDAPAIIHANSVPNIWAQFLNFFKKYLTLVFKEKPLFLIQMKFFSLLITSRKPLIMLYLITDYTDISDCGPKYWQQ